MLIFLHCQAFGLAILYGEFFEEMFFKLFKKPKQKTNKPSLTCPIIVEKSLKM